MALSYVTLALDLNDGQGNLITKGTATFTPSVQLVSTADHTTIIQAPVLAVFHPTGMQSVVLLATDSSGPLPGGWVWTVSFTGVPGNPPPFAFALTFAAGSSQYLSAQVPVASGITYTTFGGAPADWRNAVTQYGADSTGSSDASTAIGNALAAGGNVYLPAGTYLLNGAAALALTAAGTRLTGAGSGVTKIKIGGSFSATAAISVTGSSCEVADLAITGASGTTTGNPACNGIEVTGAGAGRVRDISFRNVNGWCLEVAATASKTCADFMAARLVGRNCAGGVHDLGVTGTSFLGEHFFTDLQFQQTGVTSGANANLDVMLVEDVTDVLVQGINAATASGTTGTAIHVKGACATVKMTNVDVGADQAAGVPAAIFIESGSNGTPGDVSIINGGAEGGVAVMRVDAGTDLVFTNFRVHQGYTSGIVVNGGEVEFLACSMSSNNQSGGTGYDIDTSGMTTGNARFIGCRTETALGSGAGLVTNPVSTSSHAYFYNCFFIASNNTPSTVFTGTPQIVSRCVGFNPRGQITAPTITASPFTTSTSQQDVLIVFTAVNSLTTFRIGGTIVGALPVTGQAYFLPARLSLELDYSGTVPTWQWFGC